MMYSSSIIQLVVRVTILVTSIQAKHHISVTCFIITTIPTRRHPSSLFSLQKDQPFIISSNLTSPSFSESIGVISLSDAKEEEKSNKYESIQSTITSLLQKDIPTKKLIQEHFDPHIEYIDTSMYKPINGKEALIQKFENEELKSIFGYNDDNQLVYIQDMMISIDKVNPKGFTLGLIYTIYTIFTSSESFQLENERNEKMMDCEYNGIKTLTIADSNVHSLFDVRRCSSLNNTYKNIMSTEHNFDNGKLESLIIDEQTSIDYSRISITSIEQEKVEWIIKEFFNARNKGKQEQILKMLTDEHSLECYFASDKVSDSLIIDNIFVSNTIYNQDKVKVIVQWHVEENGELKRFERGSSFYAINIDKSLIESGIDIMESEKVEESQAESVRNIITPRWQNLIRDTGLGRFVADSLVKLSVPTLAIDNSNSLFNFIALTQKKKELQYGQHKSQKMDILFPDNPNQAKGVVFFVVSI